MVEFAKMCNFLDFMKSEVNEIDLEALFFRILKMSVVKMCSAKTTAWQNRFYRDQLLNFIKNQHFWAMLLQNINVMITALNNKLEEIISNLEQILKVGDIITLESWDTNAKKRVDVPGWNPK